MISHLKMLKIRQINYTRYKGSKKKVIYLKKPKRRDLPAGDSNNANTATTINDPNLSNTGTNSIKQR